MELVEFKHFRLYNYFQNRISLHSPEQIVYERFLYSGNISETYTNKKLHI